MSTLELFWFSSCLGAVLCFAAGFVSARRTRHGNAEAEAVTSLGGDPIGEHFQWERDSWYREKAQLEQQLAAGNQGVLQTAAQERERHASEQHRLRQQLQELSSEATRAKDRLVGADREREALVHKLAKLDVEVSRAQAQSEEAAQANRVLEQKASELQSELNLTKKRLVEAQASHEDYIRLRTRRDEDTFLKSEVERLKAQLVAARAGGTMIPKSPVRRPRATGADLSKLTLSEALDVTVDGLIGEQVGSVVLADEVGFAVTHTDEHGAALAAFSSLVISAGDRAHSFAPVGKTRMISIVDEGGAQISIWPFDQDGSRLSLVTLSRSPLEHSQVSDILVQVGALLDRPRAKAAAV